MFIVLVIVPSWASVDPVKPRFIGCTAQTKSHTSYGGLWPLRRMEVTTAFMPTEKSRSSNILQTQMCWINKLHGILKKNGDVVVLLFFGTTNWCCMLLDDNIEVWLHFSVFPLIFDLALHRFQRCEITSHCGEVQLRVTDGIYKTQWGCQRQSGGFRK